MSHNPTPLQNSTSSIPPVDQVDFHQAVPRDEPIFTGGRMMMYR